MKYLSLLTLLTLLIHSVNAQSKLDSFDINTSYYLSSPNNSDPFALHDFDGRLLFTAKDSTNVRKLWETNGTYKPKEVKLNGYYADPLPNSYYIYANLNGKVYYPMYDTNSLSFSQNVSLIEYDGQTPKKVTLLRAPNDTIKAERIFGITSVNKWICFKANEKTFGNSILLYAYNPSSKQTIRIDTIKIRGNEIVHDNKLYFTVGYDTPQNKMLTVGEFDPANNKLNVYPIPNSTWLNSINEYFIFNNKLHFIDKVSRIYQLDSKTMSSPQVIDSLTSFGGSIMVANSNSNKRQILVWHHYLYFVGSINGNNGYLYRHNMLTKTTTLADSNQYNIRGGIVLYNNKLFFGATDNDTSYLEKLYMYDGINPAQPAAYFSRIKKSSPDFLTVSNDKIFLKASLNTIGTELLVYEEATAAVKNTSFNATVTVYPNPAQDVAHIKMDLQATQKLSITLMDMYGRTVYNTGIKDYKKGANITEIPTHNLAAGIYIYNISSNTGSTMMSGKLQKQ